jgi:dTDP-4-amino-4,6-dideoxygalactose transaminase
MKRTTVGDLAVFGHAPAFRDPLHVGRPHLGNRDTFIRRVDGMLERAWLTNGGPLEIEFEARLADVLGVRHAVAMCNATAALGVLALALELRGDVLLPSFTFVATAHALEWLGLRPVFCDIDRDTHNISPAAVEALISPSTSAIVGVHVWGRPCAIEGLQRVADRHGLTLIFDAAHAFGCTHGGRPIGGFGAAEVFSFHATKIMNSAEGGAVTTNDDRLAARLRSLRNFGFTGYDSVDALGINAKMSELAAALGLTSLESFDAFVDINRRHYAEYRDQLHDIPGVTLVTYDERERCNYQYVALEVDPAAARLSRDQLQHVLMAENILARRYFFPGCHRLPPYSTRTHAPLPATERLASRVLCLPSGSGLRREDIATVATIIRLAIESSAAVTARIGSQS